MKKLLAILLAVLTYLAALMALGGIRGEELELLTNRQRA